MAINDDVLAHLKTAVPAWSALRVEDFQFDDPKGFSSFTMGVRAQVPASPKGLFYRRLAGKENAILDTELEREVYLLLAREGIAATCLHYADEFRVEALYDGRTLTAEDLFQRETLGLIAAQLHRLHSLEPDGLPNENFFELLHLKWGEQARSVLEGARDTFPENERGLCDELREIYQDSTREKVAEMLPEGPLSFCHNDTYHGNIMRLASGEIRLLDFEFSCVNHPAFDFANLFAETVMEHGKAEYPFFSVGSPRFGDRELGWLIDAYLDHESELTSEARVREHARLLDATRKLIPLSDYMYAMAALPLAVEPIQKLRFIPYAHQRFTRFKAAHAERFPD